MKPLVVVFLLVGSCLSEMAQPAMKSSKTSSSAAKSQNQFAAAREGSFGSDFHATEWESVPYPAPGPVQQSPFGLGGNFNLGSPSVIEIGLTIVFAFIGVSMLAKLVGKVREIPFVQNIFGNNGRSLDANQINEMLNFAVDAYEKMQALYEN